MGQVIGIWLAAGLTLFIFSFLYKDNPFYKFAEHLYVGFSAGYWLIYTWDYTIKAMVIEPIIKHQPGAIFLVIPLFFGVIMLTRWIPSISYLSRWSIAFTVGIGSGLALIAAIQGYILPQMKATLLPVYTGNWLTSVNNLIIVVGVVASLVYFYFSKEHKGMVGKTARLGIFFIMIAFGASFGYTVMARVSLLIGRIVFLFGSWLHLIKI